MPAARADRRGPSPSRRLARSALVAMLVALPVHAEEAPPSSQTDPRAMLRGLQDSLDLSATRRKAIQADADAIKDDHAKLKAALINATHRVTEDEGKIADTQARLDALVGREDAIKRSLEGRRAVIAEVLAALQRMGRKPPPALLVDPEDILKAVRISMLLGSVLPGMKAEAETLVGDLKDLVRVHQAIDGDRATMVADLAGITTERERLTALIDTRQAALGKAESALNTERDHAQGLATQASSLKDLIGRMETESKPAADAAEAARRSDERQAVAALGPDAALRPGPPVRDPARLAPAVAFGTLRGALPLPVSGLVMRGFGAPDGFGGAEKGMSFQTGASAVVAAPSDGWIAYAGPYRSFGQLLILNAGSGYYIVLAGMDRINVDLGQFVLAGEPVAVMGDGSKKTAAAIALGAAQPILYVEFRKDGTTIDPGPWWAKPELQKVRG